MRNFFYTLFLIYTCQTVSGQDTLLLITGRKIIVSSINLRDNTISYRTSEKAGKLKTIDPYRVFSIIYRDGNERIIYSPDSLDPLDFKVDEMRNFIKGELDAQKFYKNTLLKVVGVGIGAGFGMLGFYGIIGPPLYATIVGSYSPNIEKKLSFVVNGDAANELGINSGSYLNNISGKNSSPLIKKNQQLQISNKTFKFTQDTNLDSAVSLINSQFKCIRVNAFNDNGKINLFRSVTPELINDVSYREGFEKKVREYKIRNGMLSGLIGFVAGILVYSAVF